jgi:hypothetical protein
MQNRMLVLAGSMLIALGTGCETKRTEVFMGVLTDLDAPGSLSEVNLQVFREGIVIFTPPERWRIPGNAGTKYELPASFGVFTDDGSEPRIEVQLDGYVDGTTNPVVTRRAVFALLKEQTLFMRMALVQRCVNRSDCANDLTCVEGHCRPATIDTRSLPQYIAGMENTVACQSGTVFKDTGTKQPLMATGTTCAAGDFCEEGTCYHNVSGTTSDGGTTSSGWSQAPTAAAESPPARSFRGASQSVYDPTHHQIVMWGGLGSGGAPLSDMWAFDRTQWSQVTVTGGDPVPLHTTGPIAYDSTRNVIVSYREPSGDLLEFQYSDSAGRQGMWTVKAYGSDPGAPMVREQSRLAYDPMRSVSVLFGGTAPGAAAGTAYYNDTFTWNATLWQPVAATTPPPPRRQGGFAYDNALGQIVLFSGYGTSGQQTDTWAFTGSDWRPLATAFPNHLISYDQGLLYFDSTKMRLLWMNGTTEVYTFDGTSWGAMPFVDRQSAPLLGPFSGAFDPTLNAVVTFGGEAQGAPLNQTWILNVP